MKILLVLLLVCNSYAYGFEKNQFELKIKEQLTELGGNLVNVLTTVVSQIFNNLNAQFGKRNVGEFFSDLWVTIQKIGSNLIKKFNDILAQIIYTLTTSWENAKPLYEELLSNIKDEWDNINHIISDQILQIQQVASNTITAFGEKISSIVQSLKHAFNQLIQVLANTVQSDVLEYLIETFGLSTVWSSVKEANTNLVSQFQAVLTQLLFTDQKTWESTKPIFTDLINKLSQGGPSVDEAVNEVIIKINRLLAGSI